MDRKLQAMLHTDDQTTPTIFDGGIRCPKSNGRQHMAMVVAWAVMDLDDDPEGEEPGNSIPCRAVCATCKHDWDPREDPLFEPCDFCEVKAGEPCLDWCDCTACKTKDACLIDSSGNHKAPCGGYCNPEAGK